MFRKIAITVGVLVLVLLVALVGFVATRPDTFLVQRSLSIQAPPEKIFALVNDFHKWQSWSPYEHLDPKLKRTFSGADSGVGAVYEWNGNDDAGSGRMEIVESTPPSKIVIKLDFSKPFESHNKTEFTFAPKGETNVTWAMSGPNQLMMKVMGSFMNLETMIGKDFEVGLANLKSVTEKSSAR